jgi:hypothetical protein
MILHQRPASILYNILSLTKSTFLTADMIFCTKKKTVPNSWISFFFHRKMYVRLVVQCQSHPIWFPVLPQNLTYILKFLSLLPERTCPIHTSDIPCTKSHVRFRSLKSFIQGIRPGPRPLLNFRNKIIFYGEGLLAPRPTPKLGDHPLSAVRDFLFNIFAATLHTWRMSRPPATWGRAMQSWQGTHLTWKVQIYCTYKR